ncbi:MAG: SDR family oxidoreductase [Leptospirales bacterium]
MNSFRHKRVFITGGSSGIGLACAEAFVREGASVCVIARRAKGVKSAVARLRMIAQGEATTIDPARIVGFSADVASYRQLKSAYRKCRREQGVPHILINCAGFSKPGYFERAPLHHFYRQMETNYYGAVHGVKAVLPDWIERGEGGVIVNVASVAGFMGVFGFAGYSASKFALLGYSEALRQELKRFGVRVHVACPPDTDTPGLRAENAAKPHETAVLSAGARQVTAPAVAASVLRGVRKNYFMIFANLESRWLFAMSRLFPGLTRKLMDAMISRARKKT